MTVFRPVVPAALLLVLVGATDALWRAAGARPPRGVLALDSGVLDVPEMMRRPRLPSLYAVLLNPGLPSPTGAVYRAYDDAPAGGADCPEAPADWSSAAVIDWLAGQRNDLEAPALRVTPGIGEALAAMNAAPGCRLTRMSGSGATVFGLFDDAAAAKGAAVALQRPGWWVRACVLAGAR